VVLKKFLKCLFSRLILFLCEIRYRYMYRQRCTECRTL